jgi:IclR family mhp operon transcriptional activator
LAHRRCASMAVPVRVDGDVVACMNVVWNAADLSFDEARDRLSGPLLKARDRLEASLCELKSADPSDHGGVSDWAKLAA